MSATTAISRQTQVRLRTFLWKRKFLQIQFQRKYRHSGIWFPVQFRQTMQCCGCSWKSLNFPKAAQFKHLNGFVANLGSVAIVFSILGYLKVCRVSWKLLPARNSYWTYRNGSLFNLTDRWVHGKLANIDDDLWNIFSWMYFFIRQQCIKRLKEGLASPLGDLSRR